MNGGVTSPAVKLRELRKLARPRMPVRELAERLGMPLGTYSFYEDANKFKREHLPIKLAREIAEILSPLGVDPKEVLALAGLDQSESISEIQAMSKRTIPMRVVQMGVLLPSEEALVEMFEGLLLSISENAPRTELALQLAQLLPVGLAQLQSAPRDQMMVASIVPDAALPVHASAGLEPQRQPRT